MKMQSKGFATTLVIIVIACLILGAGAFYYVIRQPGTNYPRACTADAKLCPDGSAVGRTGPNCEFAECPTVNDPATRIEFDKPIDLKIGDVLGFPGGLDVTLKSIGDSRCKPGVQCIWQGELAPVLEVNDNDKVSEVRLGTVRNLKVVSNGYIYVLNSATSNTVNLTISKN